MSLVNNFREGTCDLQIAREVITRDVYRMRAMRAAVAFAVDIGAHIGSWTLLVKSLWPEARVLSYEPWPENYKLLRQNVTTETVNAAVIGDATTARCMSRKCPGKIPNTGAVRLKSDGIPIEVVPISTVLHPAEQVDVLKLDCEGSEVDILETAARLGLLQRVGYIVGECHQCYVPDAWERIQAALKATHVVEQGRVGRSTSIFFAEARQ